MKSWLVFLGGGICGAVAALAISRWSAEIHVANAGSRGGVSQAVGPSETKPDVDEGKASLSPLDERIETLRAWTAASAEKPAPDDLYETLGEWSARDPRAALAWVQGARRFPQRINALSLPLAELGARSPAEASRWIRENLDAGSWASTAEWTYQRMANEHPREALTLAFSFSPADWPGDVGDALGALITQAPQEALGYFGRLTGERRANSARAMVTTWARGSAAEAVAWCEAQPDLMSNESVRRGLYEGLEDAHPELCVELLKRYPAGEDAAYADSETLASLLEHAPLHGLAALKGAPARTASTALTMWIGQNFERDPMRAVELVRTFLPEAERAEAMRSGFEAWLESDHRAALEWLGTVTQPELRASLQAGLIGWQTRRDPEAALAVLNSPDAASPALKGVVDQALSAWMERDVASVAGWMQANPERISEDQAAQIAGQYLRKDEAAGAAWLAQLPAGPARDAAVVTAAMHWAGAGEPELATQVVGSIRDPEKRTRALFNVYQTIRYTDAVLAESWLGRQGLEAETVRSWRAIAEGR
jgi:hypothetical protein